MQILVEKILATNVFCYFCKWIFVGRLVNFFMQEVFKNPIENTSGKNTTLKTNVLLDIF